MKECDQHKVFHVVNTSCASCPLLHFSDIDGPQLFISELCLCVCVCVCVCLCVCVCCWRLNPGPHVLSIYSTAKLLPQPLYNLEAIIKFFEIMS
jgi:hypothetical protein